MPAIGREIADRIIAMDVDVLAVQEVENIEALNTFNSNELNGLYPHRLLIEGNSSLHRFTRVHSCSFLVAMHG